MTIKEFLDMEVGELVKQPLSTEKVLALAICGLHFDGAHHKQWFLERIIDALGSDSAEAYEYGDWEDGVAP